MEIHERFRQMDTQTDVFERKWTHFFALYEGEGRREEPDGRTIYEFWFYTGRRDNYHRCKLVFLPWEIKRTASLVVTTHETEDRPALVTRSFELLSVDQLVEVLDSPRWSWICVGHLPHVWITRKTLLFVCFDE